MTRKRHIGSVAATGGLIAAIALLTGLPAASADELADLRANQELLQKRIDQLSQAPPGQAPPYVPGFGPETIKQPGGTPVVGGSFPRSFLIPGTDTSLRIGGFANASVLWYIKGAAPGGQLDGQGSQNFVFTDGQGGTGNLTAIPLNNAIGNGRGSAVQISGRQSRFLVDARTPTAWGEAKAYIEIDFSYNNNNTVENNAQAVASSWLVRLRKGYATLGGLEAGQDTGILHDPDADPELVDFGGEATANGRAREPQVKYTYAGPYGTVFTGGFENPVPRLNGPFGQVDSDTNQIPNIAACSVTGNTLAATPATTACLGSQAFFSPLQTAWPEMIGTARINQPWGHLQIGGVVRTDYLNDSQGLNQKFVGYGGSISFDAHPFSGNPGPLGKDDLGGGICAGTEMGGQCANSAGAVTNFGNTLFVPGVGFVNPLAQTAGTAPGSTAAWNARDTSQSLPASGIINGINVRQAYNRLVSTQSPNSYGAWIWYQHWWTDNLRSTLEISGIWNALNTSILGQGNTNNKQLSIAHANLFWSPVAFVDFGAEYGWGHRITVANFKGDAYTLQAEMRVRF
jgi:DcaP outer membrane protein/Porin subfamily